MARAAPIARDVIRPHVPNVEHTDFANPWLVLFEANGACPPAT